MPTETLWKTTPLATDGAATRTAIGNTAARNAVHMVSTEYGHMLQK